MGESSFAILREIGILPLEDNEEIRFTIDVYRGYRYVSIRRYVQTDGFSGPTRDGLTLTPGIIRMLEPKVAQLPDDPKEVAGGLQLGKFAKRPGICVVVAVGPFKGQPGLILRQWQEDCGWTKKGIWLPFKKIKEIKELFRKTKEVLEEQPLDDF